MCRTRCHSFRATTNCCRATSSSRASFVAGPFVEQGLAVAVINYDLCPAVTVGEIVEQCRRAMVWMAREGPVHGCNAGNVVGAGHSAGGHLAAMMVCTDWRAYGLAGAPLVGGVTLSGVHDLAPMVHFSYNDGDDRHYAHAARQAATASR